MASGSYLARLMVWGKVEVVMMGLVRGEGKSTAGREEVLGRREEAIQVMPVRCSRSRHAGSHALCKDHQAQG